MGQSLWDSLLSAKGFSQIYKNNEIIYIRNINGIYIVQDYLGEVGKSPDIRVNIIKDADPKTFSYLGDGLSKDDKNLYKEIAIPYGTIYVKEISKVQNVDVNTFQTFFEIDNEGNNNLLYAKDKNYVFRINRKNNNLEEIDGIHSDSVAFGMYDFIIF